VIYVNGTKRQEVSGLTHARLSPDGKRLAVLAGGGVTLDGKKIGSESGTVRAVYFGGKPAALLLLVEENRALYRVRYTIGK
jgi:hypothetical protein